MQSADACCGSVDDASEFGAEFRRAVFQQALLRFFSGKPVGVSIRFLRRFEPRHFAKVGSDGTFWIGRAVSSRLLAFFVALSGLRRK